MNKLVLKAEKRLLLGSKVKKLRRQGIIPANIFGHSVKSLAIQVVDTDFSRIYKDAGETTLIWIKVDGEDKERPTLVKGLTKNPTTSQKYHVDFHQVNLKEKVTANVPVEIVGEAQMVKDGLAVLDINLHEIEVEALPTDIPESLIFDISNLKEIGDGLKITETKLPDGVTVSLDPETIVIALGAPQKEEAPLEETTTDSESADSTTSEAKPAETANPEDSSKSE